MPPEVGRFASMTVFLRVLHIGTAAAWFGHKLLIPGDIRAGLADLATARTLVSSLDRAERLGQITGVGTLLTGGLLWWNVGSVDTGVMVGAGLVVLAILAGVTVARPASNRLRDSVAGDDLTGARSAARRVMAVLGIESLLWVGALVAMVT